MWTWAQREAPHPIGLVCVNHLPRFPKVMHSAISQNMTDGAYCVCGRISFPF